MKVKPETFVLDLDGVFTDGKFYYSSEGKLFKAFGQDDHDAIILLKQFLKIIVVSADHKGFEISKRRIQDDMNLELELVSSKDRIKWIQERFDVATTIYMGDGIFDSFVFDGVMYGICPSNSSSNTKQYADYICNEEGGSRAVAEACIHIAQHFFDVNLIGTSASG
jgi:3-deoxy-D-manno-octulosonate 8-phosphate phosphatase (KDO 8-P phosphatase)